MALSGAYHVGTGVAVSLSSLGVPTRVRQLDILSNPNNAGLVCIGGPTVGTDGANAWVVLLAGGSWGAEDDQGDLATSPDSVYVIAAASDKVHVSVVV
jgi:hypothetical protein